MLGCLLMLAFDYLFVCIVLLTVWLMIVLDCLIGGCLSFSWGVLLFGCWVWLCVLHCVAIVLASGLFVGLFLILLF